MSRQRPSVAGRTHQFGCKRYQKKHHLMDCKSYTSFVQKVLVTFWYVCHVKYILVMLWKQDWVRLFYDPGLFRRWLAKFLPRSCIKSCEWTKQHAATYLACLSLNHLWDWDFTISTQPPLSHCPIQRYESMNIFDKWLSFPFYLTRKMRRIYCSDFFLRKTRQGEFFFMIRAFNAEDRGRVVRSSQLTYFFIISS